MKSINKDNRLPLYYQLYDMILNQIETGMLKENDKLPSERELCHEYDISRSTVRQTMAELEKGGYIYKKHGKGVFVSPKALKQDLLKFYSFTEEMKKIGKMPTSKVISFESIECNKKVAKKLKCEPGDNVYKFTRLRLADGKPMMLETSYIPTSRFVGLTKEDLDRNAMYDIFKERYNVTFSKAEECFKSVNTRLNEAKLLEVDAEIPSMMIERITYENDNIIEYTVGIARGDSFQFRVVLEK